MRLARELTTLALGMGAILFTAPFTHAYEVAVGLGSTAGPAATIAMGDRSKWPDVADLSWGPLANLVPIGQLGNRNQQAAVFNNFKQRRAITELPFPSISWSSSQPDINFIESFGLSVPYVFVLYEHHERVRDQGQVTADALKAAGVIDSMLTRDEILRLKARFPNKKIIMNTRAWTRDKAHLQKVEDVLDGVTIEFIPQDPAYINFDVAPFAEWAHNNDKILLLLMPPQPDYFSGDKYVKAVTESVQEIYDANVNRLPHGWMKSDKIIFIPANYSWVQSQLTYVPEDAENSVLAAAKQLLLMRPALDAGPVRPAASSLSSIFLLLN